MRALYKVFLFLIFDIVLHIFTAALSWTSWSLIYSPTPTMGTLPLSNLHYYTPAPRLLHPQSLLLSRPPPSADNHTCRPPTPPTSTTIIIIIHNRHHYLYQHHHTTCPQPRSSPSSTLISKTCHCTPTTDLIMHGRHFLSSSPSPATPPQNHSFSLYNLCHHCWYQANWGWIPPLVVTTKASAQLLETGHSFSLYKGCSDNLSGHTLQNLNQILKMVGTLWERIDEKTLSVAYLSFVLVGFL